MLLSEIFEHLNYGELAQVSLAGAEEEGIVSGAYPAIISHLNMALITLYTRFPLRIREVQIQLYSSITEYQLKASFATNSGSLESPKYLIDTANDPFLARILKVERVETDDPKIVDDLPLNDLTEETSVHTTAYNTLKVPTPNDTDILTVHFRAAPDKIIAAGLDPETVEIPIPDSLLEPLVYYIASRAHANVPSLDGQPTDSMMYLQKFEQSVAKVEALGLIENTHTNNTKLENNGWV